MLVADDVGREDAAGRVERVDGGVDAEAGDLAREDRRRVEVREGGSRGRVREVVRGHVDGLHRRDGPVLGRRNALLHRAHLGRERRLVADGTRHAAEKRRDFGARLREAEDVVDEEEDVAAALVAEVLGERQARESDAGTGSGGLVHLAEHERRLAALERLVVDRVEVPPAGLERVHEGLAVVEDARLEHLAHEVVALARALADAGEHRHPVVRLGDVVDQLLDEDRLADARAAEEADLAAARVGLDEVDDLDAGLEDLDRRRELVVRRRVGVDRAVLRDLGLAEAVDGLPDDVEEPPTDGLADGHLDRPAHADDGRAAREAVRGVHRDRPHAVLAQVLLDLEHERIAVAGDLERVVDLGHLPGGELAVDDGADDLQDAAGLSGGAGSGADGFHRAAGPGRVGRGS